MIFLTFSKGKPKEKGYYIARRSEQDYEFEKYGVLLWWNGKNWQDYSDDDTFDLAGNQPVSIISNEAGYDEYCEVNVDA